MSVSVLTLVLLALGMLGYVYSYQRAFSLTKIHGRAVHSRPHHHAWFTLLWTFVPAALLGLLWLTFGASLVGSLALQAMPAGSLPQDPAFVTILLSEARGLALGMAAQNVSPPSSPQATTLAEIYRQYWQQGTWLVSTIALSVALIGLVYAGLQTRVHFRARTRVEHFVMGFLILCSLVAILTTLGIVLSLAFESFRFFGKVPLVEFFFGDSWSPQIAIRADQVGSTGGFGAGSVFWGTLFTAFIAMLVAVPIGLMCAIYLTQYATPNLRKTLKPILEILAGVPTVVYGFFAALTVAPLVRDLGQALGFEVAAQSALAAGLVMGVMIIPFVSSLSDDAITAVPQSMKDGSLAMGATPSETIRKVLLPAALPGIVGGVLLAVSRAIGETMIVVMAAGLEAKFTLNPFDSVTTVTVQIVKLLTGDQEAGSPKTLAAFALGMVLFLVTLMLNIYALRIVKKYREAYD
jgi:phosphate transport system permease protein